MAVEMKIPAVGESITEVTVGTWYKKEGDSVKMDDVLCGLDSDKATFELTAEADGVLHILAQEGDVLPIGASICTIDGNSSAPSAATPALESAKASTPPVEAAKPAPATVSIPEQDPTPALQPVAEPAGLNPTKPRLNLPPKPPERYALWRRPAKRCPLGR